MRDYKAWFRFVQMLPDIKFFVVRQLLFKLIQRIKIVLEEYIFIYAFPTELLFTQSTANQEGLCQTVDYSSAFNATFVAEKVLRERLSWWKSFSVFHASN